MKKRVITGVVGGFYIGLATYIGGMLFGITILGISLLALFELDKSVNDKKNIVFKTNYLTAIMIFFLMIMGIGFDLFMVITIHTIVTGIVFVVHNDTKFKDLAVSFFGLTYIILLFYHALLFSDYIHFWLVYIITFGSDSFAYIVGSNFGKHKLSPKLSPKKSVEGVVGGLIGACVIALIFNYYVLKESNTLIAMIAIIGSGVSVLGDLLASKIKREFGIKDYSNILPGHGGILDRFDSFLMVAPITYYLVMALLF